MGCLGGTLSVILSGEKWFKRCFILCNQLEGREISPKIPPSHHPAKSRALQTEARLHWHHISKCERPPPSFTFRPASLLWRFMAARASCPVSKASTNCLEMASPKPTLSLQPPHSQPWPPGNEMRVSVSLIVKPLQMRTCVCRFDSRTSLPVPAVVAAAVVEISEAAVPG